MADTDPFQNCETYHANCHCGLIRFEFQFPPLKSIKVVACNCSICVKNGYLLIYPFTKDIVFTRGEEQLKSYRFGSQRKPQKFCPNCSTSILIDFSELPNERSRVRSAVNVRFSPVYVYMIDALLTLFSLL